MIRDERRRKKKRKRLVITLLLLILLIAAAIAIILNVFVLENVEVEGNVLYDDEAISSVILNDEYSQNSLYVYLKYRFQEPEQVPFVDTMSVTLKNPHTLHVSVYEKGILGSIYISSIGENAYFDKDGIVVETSSRKIEDVPVIEGLACETVVLYEALPIDKNTRKDILSLTQILKKYELIPDTITYQVKDEPMLTYGSIRVLVGSQDKLNEKIERMSKIMPSLAGKQGILHLETWTEQTTDIVFEET